MTGPTYNAKRKQHSHERAIVLPGIPCQFGCRNKWFKDSSEAYQHYKSAHKESWDKSLRRRTEGWNSPGMKSTSPAVPDESCYRLAAQYGLVPIPRSALGDTCPECGDPLPAKIRTRNAPRD